MYSIYITTVLGNILNCKFSTIYKKKPEIQKGCSLINRVRILQRANKWQDVNPDYKIKSAALGMHIYFILINLLDFKQLFQWLKMQTLKKFFKQARQYNETPLANNSAYDLFFAISVHVFILTFGKEYFKEKCTHFMILLKIIIYLYYHFSFECLPT